MMNPDLTLAAYGEMDEYEDRESEDSGEPVEPEYGFNDPNDF